MLQRLRERLRDAYGHAITAGGQVLILAVAGHIREWHITLASLALVAVISLFAWLSAIKRHQAIADTPTSRIASAAQGLVELTGRGRPQGQGLTSPLRPVPCLWFRYRIERKSGKEWHTEESGESSEPFLLDDGSGLCLLDPDGAEILPRHRDCWTEGSRRYTQWLLLPDAPLYALGEFMTVRNIASPGDKNERIKALLARWKEDRTGLLARFDLDRDGEIDMKEWQLARAQARREVTAATAEEAERPATNLMRRPAEGFYLISDLDPAELARKYRRWSWFHLAVFLGSLGAEGWFSGHPF